MQQQQSKDETCSSPLKAATKNQYVLFSRFVLKEKLGAGSFGQIYRALDQNTNEDVALKLEKISSTNSTTLSREAKILQDISGEQGLPTLYYYGKEGNYSAIAMSLLGINLEKLFKACSHRFSLKTVLMIGDQLIARIENLHSKGYLHRDIKSENFVIGPSRENNMIYMIDYGLSKLYLDSNGKHLPYKDKRGLVGTARYVSVHTHNGIEQSRRDDLESIGYSISVFS